MARGDKLAEGACSRRGTHTTVRPGQRFCDLCRPLEAQQALDRQRAHRAKLRARKRGLAVVKPPVLVPNDDDAAHPCGLEDASYTDLLDELLAKLGDDARRAAAALPPKTVSNLESTEREVRLWRSTITMIGDLRDRISLLVPDPELLLPS